MKNKKYSLKNIVVPRFKEENGFYTTPERSMLMSKIKGKGTKPEIILRKALYLNGVRYRINRKDLPGQPDIVIKKYRLVIFIDGEFWHGHNWEEKKNKIKTNRGFWIPKIERNMQRDRQNEKNLEDMGYTVLRYWETEVNKNLESCIKEILCYIKENGKM